MRRKESVVVNQSFQEGADYSEGCLDDARQSTDHACIHGGPRLGNVQMHLDLSSSQEETSKTTNVIIKNHTQLQRLFYLFLLSDRAQPLVHPAAGETPYTY
jgi:hypothetical protein